MKLWSGRFAKSSDQSADDFNTSLPFDYRLYRHDIQGSIAHCTMLSEQKIIPAADAKAIIDGLNNILADIDNGSLEITSGEDIHMFVESELISRIGDTGKKLHTGRSRNDQVALDTRMYLRDSITNTSALLRDLCQTLLTLAEKHARTVMPGYTHMQKAQPVTLGHHLNAYTSMFVRDMDRLNDCRRRVNVLPLGSGALAGTTYPLNRERVAELLNFDSVSLNSLDAVSDRDYILEYLSAGAILCMHMSRLCEELIYWSGDEFGFVSISDEYSTGSSIMPNKKNPDMCELIRGKTGRAYGNLISLLTVMKALPLAYNKDMQEDKEPMFDTERTLNTCVSMLNSVIATATFRTDRMRSGALGGFSAATDIADYMVKHGIPFRTAHEITGKIVLRCETLKITLDELSLEEYRSFHPVFDSALKDAISLDAIVSNRSLTGGTAPSAVINTIGELRNRLKQL